MDSGSDGDLVFRKQGARLLSNFIPYVTRSIPQSWHTSSGIFRTEKQGECQIVFVEYLVSKQVTITPDIVEYDKDGPDHLFGLVIGTETMTRLGIILDFQTKMITIDDINLPMRHIKSLQKEQTRLQLMMQICQCVTSKVYKRSKLDEKFIKIIFCRTTHC